MVCAVGSFKLVFYQLQIFSCQSRRAAGRDDAAAVEYKTTNTKAANANTNTNTKPQTQNAKADNKNAKSI